MDFVSEMSDENKIRSADEEKSVPNDEDVMIMREEHSTSFMCVACDCTLELSEISIEKHVTSARHV